LKLNWVIGDIHGCYEALQRLEEKILVRCENLGAVPFIVSVGDLVDRGPGSDKVVAHFMAGVEAGTHAVVLGNHEVIMINCLEHYHPRFGDGIPQPSWFQGMETRHAKRRRLSRYASLDEYTVFTKLVWTANGGAETLSSYGGDPYEPDSWLIPDDHFAFLASRPLYWEDDYAVVTHAFANAGDIVTLRSEVPLSDEGLERVIWGRKRPQKAPAPPKRHVSGHTPRARVLRDDRLHIAQIDTGAYMGGRLTAWCTALDATISVPSKVTWRM